MSQGRNNQTSSTPVSSQQCRFTPPLSSNSPASSSASSVASAGHAEEEESFLIVEESSAETSVTYLQVPNRSQDWHDLSRHGDRIYRLVTKNPMQTAANWANLLQQNRRKAVHCFIRFIADLCKHQQDNIEHFDYAQTARLVGDVEQNPSRQFDLPFGRYLMTMTSSSGKQILKAVLDFVCQAVFEAEYREPLTVEILREILKYLYCLSQSNMAASKHISVIIAARMITGFADVIDALNQELQTSFETPELLTVKSKVDDRLVQIDKIIALLLKIFEDVCAIYYQRSVEMSLDCLREMGGWIKKYPKIISPKTKYARMLRRYIPHPTSEVRLEAISIATNIVHMPVNDYLKELILKICPQLQDMLLDVCYEVSIKAIEFFTILLSNESYYFKLDIKEFILMTVNKHYPLASAAGKYLISYIRRLNGNIDKSKLIVCLLKILEKGMKTRTAFFVESIIDCAPELTMWELIFELLRGSSLKENEKNVLLVMFRCTVHQILAGCSVKRENQETAPKNSIAIKDASQMYLQNFNFLMDNFAAQNPAIAIEFIDLLKLINYDKLSNDECKENLHKVANQLKNLINNKNNMKVIKAACHALNVFCKSSKEMVKNRGCMVIQTITEELWATYVSLFEEYKQDSNDETAVAVRDSLKLLSTLHGIFDLTEKIHWSRLFSMWTEIGDKLLNYCVQFYLITLLYSLKWQMRNLLQCETVDQDKTKSIRNKYSLFMSTCLSLLEKSVENHVLVLTFKCSLEILLTQKREAMKDFLFKLKDKEVTQLTHYARFHFFENAINEEDYTERCIEMKKILDAVLLGTLPLQVLVELFKYYSSHYDKYGTVFDSVLESIYSTSKTNLSFILFKILKTIYQELWSVHSDIQRSPEFFDLKRLVIKLREFYKIKGFDGKLELMRLSINFSSTYQANYLFLYFVHTFATILSLQEVKLCLNQINSCHPDFKENDQTKRVIMLLKAISNDLRDGAQKKTHIERVVPDFSVQMEHLNEEFMYDDDQDLSEGIEDPDEEMEVSSDGDEDFEEIIEDSDEIIEDSEEMFEDSESE